MKLLAPIIGVLMLANAANAESPRVQLRQMVERLQKSPDDNTLREKIIKLAMKMNPMPALPEEARQRLVQGSKMFGAAQNLEDYRRAENEFKRAILIAPWWADAYCQLGEAQSKAGERPAAISSFESCALGTPPGDMRERNQARFKLEKMLQKEDEKACGKNGGLTIRCGTGRR
ncbi:MAG TPA: hypothetical protein VGK14_04255 [Novimethylophilus sp.]|jgi:tetratricopeptide (TPR) repeat protein|uniref:hypothetical protein n=1 Tax=Novimethylophilus sp. TaxID=2137426 RepID=UPI002F3F8760